MPTHELSQAERNILLSSMRNGMIPLPDGSAHAVDKALKSFEELASRGYLEYTVRNGFRAYWITELGRQALNSPEPTPARAVARKGGRRSIAAPGLLNVIHAT